jgi:hypothetical protein
MQRAPSSVWKQMTRIYIYIYMRIVTPSVSVGGDAAQSTCSPQRPQQKAEQQRSAGYSVSLKSVSAGSVILHLVLEVNGGSVTEIVEQIERRSAAVTGGDSRTVMLGDFHLHGALLQQSVYTSEP